MTRLRMTRHWKSNFSLNSINKTIQKRLQFIKSQEHPHNDKLLSIPRNLEKQTKYTKQVTKERSFKISSKIVNSTLSKNHEGIFLEPSHVRRRFLF